MATKKEARQRAADWRQAVIEGRVLCFGETTFRSYLSPEAAVIAEHDARSQGYPVRRVQWQAG